MVIPTISLISRFHIIGAWWEG